MRTTVLVLISAVFLFTAAAAPLGAEPVRTADEGGRRLDAPGAHESFTFAVFGDRAPGSDAGLEVLERAVRTANLLGVRFVMTTGNMIDGDTHADRWTERVGVYRRRMTDLSMDWYPVPGPLDTAIRSASRAGARATYRDQFGPMYYAFDTGWVHVVVLASELLEMGDPERAEQLRWLGADLRATDAEQVFVFVHEPMWNRPADRAWDAVHEILREDGRPTRVISGGTRYARDDGVRNTVRYGSVAMTGAFASDTHGYASRHSVTLVNVTPLGHRLAVVPHDAAAPGDTYTGVDADAIEALIYTGWASVEGFVQAGAERGDGAAFEAVLENPTDRRFGFDIETVTPDGWVLTRERISGQIEPGQTLRMPVRAESPPLDGTRPEVEVVVTARYPVTGGRTHPVVRRLTVPVRPRGAEDIAGPVPGNNGAIDLRRSGAVRVDIGAAPWRLTAECWVKTERPEGNAVALSRFGVDASGAARGFAIAWSRPGGVMPAAMAGTESGLARAVMREPPEWGVWHHVAMTYDGSTARMYLDGRLVDESEPGGELIHPDLPLYIGAEPNPRGDPVSRFDGMIDEVRVSSVVRYDGPFTPARVFEPDPHTLVLMHFDTPMLGAHPDHSGRGNHGWEVGEIEFVREPR